MARTNNNAPLKIAIVFGTRPEAIKLFPLIHLLRDDPRFAPVVVSTGQHRAMLDQVLAIAQVVPDHDLAVMRADQSLDALTARLLTGIGETLDAEAPDWVVVQGDTASAMCGALAAFYRKIPICHVEAGLRSGDIHHPWPEEVNRKVIGTMAALHCAPTQTAADALRRENIDPASIHVTGNTVIDALQWVLGAIERKPDLAADLHRAAQRFAGKRIIGVTTHRRENFGEGMRAVARAIRAIAERDDTAVLFPVHLNPNVRATMHDELGGLGNVALLEPLDYPNFAALMQASTLMLTDSGGVQEEAPALGKPVLVMRATTERPEGVEAGTAKLVGTDPQAIQREVFRLLDDESAYAAMAQAHNPFGDGHSSQRIAELMVGN
ncbi:UDP-N-acetylglucosamine 2-epimerase [Citromicrobium sp. RCC1885]|uniref:non-hydrolyzing UDP-N-acetylglucosamine 2-epimerase n=1 Tax=unclassified Citromicrobium TaxID=2630544 RepID=UPI0006C930DC|nr:MULTISPECIES: UDP-N-acetylglucosamine 2-epimerase (non-hydrolyzing) [unclassified Citromicrobium]KPM21272.1 UDP-N-acetylglucosamine 2-epimerase [Citromicrobium sp. RCC1885]KPM29351.1 UDP-N-acetylglucosamine 2-epimerase [Citromicrobium sp. RCC1878]MAO05743.1 UDP-N-acetylglucosamine 2-epimerase (non-hydrolyzing) [Citromicrobium sp.]OAM06618.1 UDP-N-acetyl glucosamine 2-epimerase [Citromicrobium sp. RCC1897]|tara:strand:- start:919 stop:2058 length:1140 start_codon:yes stop_codon:yes gene_type:complete